MQKNKKEKQKTNSELHCIKNNYEAELQLLKSNKTIQNRELHKKEEKVELLQNQLNDAKNTMMHWCNTSNQSEEIVSEINLQGHLCYNVNFKI